MQCSRYVKNVSTFASYQFLFKFTYRFPNFPIMSAPKVHVYKVAMTCEGCSGAVERVLNKLKDKGVQNINIDLPGQTVKVTTTLPSNEILDVIKKTGKETEFIQTL